MANQNPSSNHSDPNFTKAFDVANYQNNAKCPYKPPDKSLYGVGCEKHQCHAAMMDKINMPQLDPNRSPEQVMAEAKEFLTEYYRDEYSPGEGDRQKAFDLRWEQVTKEIKEKGYYFQTYEELHYGVRLAWRNSSRCIMRIQWRNINVIDKRGPNAEYGREIKNEFVFKNCVEHLRGAIEKASDGSKVIQTRMTVFPQLLPGQKVGCKIWNPQLLRFAGYKRADGTILGDPAQEELTEILSRLGWDPETNEENGKRTAFDILPLMIQTEASMLDEGILIKELPEDSKVLVPIVHPDYPEFEQLGIKWHAVPALSNFILDVGGIQYPCIPFNGWYMETEIGCRNLGDVQRYNLLPEIARVLKMKMSANSDLWRDKALVELNRAVLFSFQQKERITIIDHHTASDSFIRFHKKEMEDRGYVSADWVWLVPPIGGSVNSVFHQEMINFYIKPNFLPPSHTIKQLLSMAEEKGALKSDNSKMLNKKNSSRNLSKATSLRPMTKRLSLKRPTQVLIYFGSETGVSESFATRIHKIFQDKNSRGDYELNELMSVAPIPLEQLNLKDNLLNIPEKRETVLIIVTSTFGSGGPPRNAEKFSKALAEVCQKKRENAFQTTLEHLRLFLLGIGSSSYAKFNGFAKTIRESMTLLGVSNIIYEEADEVKDPEGTVEVFMKRIGEQLNLNVFKDSSNPFRKSQSSLFEYKLTLSMIPFMDTPSHRNQPKARPFFPAKSIVLPKKASSTNFPSITSTNSLSATLTFKEAISEEGTDREALLLRFSIQPLEDDLQRSLSLYNEGDHIAIYPKNSAEEVDRLLNFLNLNGDNFVQLHALNSINETDNKDIPNFLSSGKNRLRDILTDYLDLSAAPSYKFIKAASSHALPGSKDRIILDYYGLDIAKYEKWVAEDCPSHVTFFQTFTTLQQRLPLQEFLLQCKTIKPRMYSVASSPEVERNEIHIATRKAFMKTKQITPLGLTEVNTRRGLCTGYLWDLQLNNPIQIAVNPNPEFSLPEKSVDGRPIVMKANGLGIAPFRGIWKTLIARCKKNDGYFSYQGYQKNSRMTHKRLQPSFVLFFGCRNSSEHLFQSEMKDILQYDSVTAKIFISYSRAESESDGAGLNDDGSSFSQSVFKVGHNSMTVRTPRDHVDKAIKSEAALLLHLVNNHSAKIYICGSSEMQKSVDKAFEAILSPHKVNHLKSKGDYVTDVF